VATVTACIWRKQAFAIAFVALAAPVHASDLHLWPGTLSSMHRDAWVRIGPPEADGAVATVTFQNEMVHPGHENFEITFGDLTVRCVVARNVTANGAEELTVEPPAGYAAVPRQILVDEKTSGRIHIYPFLGM